MSEVKTSKIVNVALRVTEHPSPLPGTAAWVLEQIRGGYLKVGVTKSKQPGVWLYHGPEQDKSQLLALYDTDFQDNTSIDYFPFEEEECFGYNQNEALGVNLTDAGVNVLKQLAKKAKVLLKLRMQQSDRKGKGKMHLTVKMNEVNEVNEVKA